MIPFCFIRLAKNIKFDALMICISKHEITRWNYSLHRCNYEIIMNHIASRSCRRLSYKTSELHFEISLRRFSFHRSPSSYRKRRGKNSRGNRYGETRLVSETLQTVSASPVPSSSLLFREKSIARRTRARFSRSR